MTDSAFPIDDYTPHGYLDNPYDAGPWAGLDAGGVIRSMEADMAAIGAEVERLQGRKRHLAGRADWLKRYLQGEMEAVGKAKVRGPTLTVSLAKAPPSCEVVCPDEVPVHSSIAAASTAIAIIARRSSTLNTLPVVIKGNSPFPGELP